MTGLNVKTLISGGYGHEYQTVMQIIELPLLDITVFD